MRGVFPHSETLLGFIYTRARWRVDEELMQAEELLIDFAGSLEMKFNKHRLYSAETVIKIFYYNVADGCSTKKSLGENVF